MTKSRTSRVFCPKFGIAINETWKFKGFFKKSNLCKKEKNIYKAVLTVLSSKYMVLDRKSMPMVAWK